MPFAMLANAGVAKFAKGDPISLEIEIEIGSLSDKCRKCRAATICIRKFGTIVISSRVAPS